MLKIISGEHATLNQTINHGKEKQQIMKKKDKLRY